MNEATIKVLFEEILKCFCFNFGGVVYQTERWVCTFLELDVMVELGVEVRKFVGLGFAEDIKVIMVFRRDLGIEGVEFIGGNFTGFCSASSASSGFRIREFDVQDSRIDLVDPGEHSECGCIHEAELWQTLGHWCQHVGSRMVDRWRHWNGGRG